MSTSIFRYQAISYDGCTDTVAAMRRERLRPMTRIRATTSSGSGNGLSSFLHMFRVPSARFDPWLDVGPGRSRDARQVRI